MAVSFREGSSFFGGHLRVSLVFCSPVSSSRFVVDANPRCNLQVLFFRKLLWETHHFTHWEWLQNEEH